MNKKHKNVCRVLNYTEHLLIVISTINGYISISASAFLVGISIGSNRIVSSTIGLKICELKSIGLKIKEIIRSMLK